MPDVVVCILSQRLPTGCQNKFWSQWCSERSGILERLHILMAVWTAGLEQEEIRGREVWEGRGR